ncbi:MAG: leucine-rich repeat domain-containing protein, partial [Muribaculaceae bacterium]|nr:leucine-rich repeat domain-containing protein [Muribaculaceae bacterium]
MRKILIASIITVFAMLEALAQTPGEFARRVCGVSETDTVAVVPRGVKEIPDYGFYGLSSLRRVELPEGVEKIGRSAFAWCDSLREVRLPKSLTDIGAHAFAYCERME